MCLTVLLYPIAALAGGQADQWWRTATAQRHLRLTPAQVASLEATFHATLLRRRALNEALARNEAALRRALDRADEQLVAALIDRVQEARADRNTARTMMLMRMYRLLTPQQRRLLAQLPVTGSPLQGIPVPKR